MRPEDLPCPPVRPGRVVAAFSLAFAAMLVAGPVAADERSRFPWFARKPAPPLPSLLVSADDLAGRAAEAQVVVVDVRAREAFEAGHLPGAVGLGAGPWPEDFPALCAFLGAAGLSAGSEVVLVDATGDPSTLARPFYDLSRIGHASVRVLVGGMASWQGEVVEGEVVEGEVVPRPRTERSCQAGEATLRADELAPQVGLAGVEILDLRAGWSEDYGAPTVFSVGHVPHALPFELGDPLPDLSPEGLETLRQRVLELGPRQGERVRPGARFVLYDEGPEDDRDVLAFFQLRLVGFDTAVLDQGLSGWVASESPLVRLLGTVPLASWLVDTEGYDDAPLVFDLREEWDHRAGHLPGALSLPAKRVASELLERIGQQRPGAELAAVPLVFYCYGRDCVRSREAASEAARQGAQWIYWFREGVEGWRAAGFELEQDAPPPGSGAP